MIYKFIKSLFGRDALVFDSLVKVVLIKRKDALYELHEVHDVAASPHEGASNGGFIDDGDVVRVDREKRDTARTMFGETDRVVILSENGQISLINHGIHSVFVCDCVHRLWRSQSSAGAGTKTTPDTFDTN